MKRLYAATAALMVGGALVAPPAAAQSPTATPQVVPAAVSDYPKAKRNRFWRVVSRYEPSVKIAGKTSTIELGVATCDLLRAGGDLYDLTYLLLDSDAGAAEDAIMAIMAAAPVVLCPDQQYKFDD